MESLEDVESIKGLDADIDLEAGDMEKFEYISVDAVPE